MQDLTIIPIAFYFVSNFWSLGTFQGAVEAYMKSGEFRGSWKRLTATAIHQVPRCPY